jgi:hypothetical protein
MKDALPEGNFEVVAVRGATVSGLPNPNPISQAMPRFRAALDTTDARTVLTLLGEVDTGFVIWYRAQKYGMSVASMLDQALANYQDFLRAIAARFHTVCVSTPLPTIRDGTDRGAVANARREVTATQLQRTQLTLLFNQRMQAFCGASGMQYIMLDQDSLGPDGLLRLALRSRLEKDHHYDAGAYAKLLAPFLRTLTLRPQDAAT